jgi:hypothetical protein
MEATESKTPRARRAKPAATAEVMEAAQTEDGLRDLRKRKRVSFNVADEALKLAMAYSKSDKDPRIARLKALTRDLQKTDPAINKDKWKRKVGEDHVYKTQQPVRKRSRHVVNPVNVLERPDDTKPLLEVRVRFERDAVITRRPEYTVTTQIVDDDTSIYTVTRKKVS